MLKTLCTSVLCLAISSPATAQCDWDDDTMMVAALSGSGWTGNLKRWASVKSNKMDMRRPDRSASIRFSDDMSDVSVDGTTLALAVVEGDGQQEITLLWGSRGDSFSVPIGSTDGGACAGRDLSEIMAIGRTTLERRQADMRLHLRVVDQGYLIGLLRIERIDAFGLPHLTIEAVEMRPAP